MRKKKAAEAEVFIASFGFLPDLSILPDVSPDGDYCWAL